MKVYSMRNLLTGLSGLRCFIVLSLSQFSLHAYSAANENIEFNTDVLDLKDRSNIDLSQFSQVGFIMPGVYTLTVKINNQDLTDLPIEFYSPENDDKKSYACVNADLVNQLGLKASALPDIKWAHEGKCLDLSSFPGLTAEGDLGTSTLNISIPQTYLEYTDANWDPPSRWDDGVSGVLLDYNINTQERQSYNESGSGLTVSGNGVAGMNLGSWRFRSDWQMNIDHTSNNDASERQKLEWNRYYLYRAVTSLKAKLTVGEDYLNSDIFDSFRYTGMSLISDDSMLPPNLRGYAPEVTGIARTNAKVTISQQGRVIYESQVAAGPFRIQDINDAVSGQLDVRVEEQNGQVQTFQVSTANIPYLTRPGSVRYKVIAGRPSQYEHSIQGPSFIDSELSWGVSNGWSLYGGLLGGTRDYNALSVGLGRDLMLLGALSFDVTKSRAQFPQQATLEGNSYRLSYSKNFDEYDSEVTFAGYRFSQRDFMSMSEYLDARYNEGVVGSSKEMYTLTFNKHFDDLAMSAYLNYNHQTYWDMPDSDRYSLTMSRYFDIGNMKNLSLSLTASRTQNYDTHDDSLYVSLSMPFGGTGNINYSATINKENSSQNIGYSNQVGEHDNYQIQAGLENKAPSFSGYYGHEGDIAQINTSASYQAGQYTSLGLSLQGGMTATPKGAAVHRISTVGGTRLMVDTEGVSGVPVRGYGSATDTNIFGKAVIGDVNSYYRNNASIDIEHIADNVEAIHSTTSATLTEGAIGYRQFDVIAGSKMMAAVRMADGTTPPFGATVLNDRKQETGIINDDGVVYLSGIQPGEKMSVNWDGKVQCMLFLPNTLPAADLQNNMLLPCK